jgi:serine/threonine-protein kinase
VSGTDATVPIGGDAAAAPAPATTAPQPTRVAGRYDVLGLLGEGGMGTVYRARDRELDELVALKVLRAGAATDEAIARFRQEVKLARRVTHANVARTFDLGEDEAGVRFLTMELVEGESLADRLAREGKLDVAAALGVARALLAGLAAAHDAGVIHRDLKPANVLLGRDGRVVVTDFGIARGTRVGATGSATADLAVGTPAYIAPEQLEAARDVDARADLDAFGALLFEVVTGRRAWEGDDALAVAVARLTRPPPDPIEVAPALPPRLAEVIRTCMARDRRERFATARDALAALQAVHAAASPEAQAPRPAIAIAARGRETTVAVLPFRNAGPADDDYLADGISEELGDALSMNHGLRVRARGAVLALDAAARLGDVRDLGRRLGVTVVVDGTLRRIGAAVRLTVRLLGVEDGFTLWTERLDCDVGALFARTDAIAAAIATSRSAPAPGARRAAADPEAVDLVLRAKHASEAGWITDVTPLDLFERALARAPDDPAVLAAYAIALARHMPSGTRLRADYADHARRITARAIAAAPDLAEAWVADAGLRLHDGDDLGAIAALQRALALAPGSADAQDVAGRMLVDLGDHDEGVARLERALWTNPTLAQPRLELVRVHAQRGDHARVDAALDGPELARDPLRRHLGRTRMDVWRRRPLPPTPPGLAIDGPTGQLTAIYADITATGALGGASRAFFDGVLAAPRVPPRSRRMFAQFGAELAAYVDDDEAAIAYAARGVDAGLAEPPWFDLPLFARVASAPRWGALREAAARTSEVRLRAWRAGG